MVPDDSQAPQRAWFSADAMLGSVLGGRYRLDDVIGSGGSAVVFEALDTSTQRRVALKLHRAQKEGPEVFRMLREVEVTSTLSHPHIVGLLDWGMYEETFPFLVFELLQGRTLEAERLALGPMDPAHVLSILLPIMGAVAYAHDRGVLHRDLKTQNIFLVRDEHGRVVPKLLDFGAAKSEGDASLTRSGAIVGTPAFMSPEQALAEPLDARTDVWSMGVVLFATLTGALPFSGESHTRTLLELVSSPAPSLGDTRGLPSHLCAAVEKALARDRERRYADMRAFARALKAAALKDGIAVPESPDALGLPEWAAWTAEDDEFERDFEITYAGTNCVARYKDCIISLWHAAPSPGPIVAGFELGRRMQTRFGRFSILVIVAGDASLPDSQNLGEIMRFYDTHRLRCVANVLEARGVQGRTHRAIMATIHFVRRRDYPGKVFADVEPGARWLASQVAPEGGVDAYTAGLCDAVRQMRAQAQAS